MLEEFGSFVGRMVEKQTVGSVEFFEVDPFLSAAEILVASDDPVRALNVLDNLPGYYRDNVPPEVARLRKEISAKLATPAFYMTNTKDDINVELSNKDFINQLTRGQVILQDFRGLNDNAKPVMVVDLGPGDYWLPIGLMHSLKEGESFGYMPIGLHDRAAKQALEIMGVSQWDNPHDSKWGKKMFVASEIIEHLRDERDIFVEQQRHCPDADIIHITTPFYTFDGREERFDWRSWDVLQHMRTYTPKEFYSVVINMWPDYTWNLLGGNVMHMRGAIKN